MSGICIRCGGEAGGDEDSLCHNCKTAIMMEEKEGHLYTTEEWLSGREGGPVKPDELAALTGVMKW